MCDAEFQKQIGKTAICCQCCQIHHSFLHLLSFLSWFLSFSLHDILQMEQDNVKVSAVWVGLLAHADTNSIISLMAQAARLQPSICACPVSNGPV